MKPKAIHVAGLLVLLPFLASCGAMTGLPGHGGGKRFAVEQELVAAATRAAIKQIDLKTIRGKKVSLYVNAIGDTGNGNVVGGRFSVFTQLRGDYIQTPVTTERSVFPRYTSSTATQQNSSSSTTASSSSSTNTNSEESSSTTTSLPESTSTTTGTGNSDSSTRGTTRESTSANSSSTSTTDTLLPYPETKESEQVGAGGVMQGGVKYEGLGAYANSTDINSNDLQYLNGLLQAYLFLAGVNVVPPSEAEVDVYITVDVFGTVRTRVDWFIANNEILRAKTTLEVLAIEHDSGKLIMEPQSAGAEVEYNEQYVLWAGPISIRKTLKKGDQLLCDFTDMTQLEQKLDEPVEQSESVPYPFRREVQEWGKDEYN